MFAWVNNILKKTFKNFTVETAKNNVTKYENKFIDKQNKYKNEIILDIIDRSKHGERCLYIFQNEYEPWLTEDYIRELKIFFEQRNFNVKENLNLHGNGYLIISW